MQMCTVQIKGTPAHGLLIPGRGFLKRGTMGLFPRLLQLGPLCNAAAFLPEDVWLIILFLIIDKAPSLSRRSHWTVRSRVGFLHGDLITPPAHSRLTPAFRMNRRGQLCSCTFGLSFHFHGFARVARFSDGRSQRALLDLVLIMCSQEVSYVNKEHAGKKTSVTFKPLSPRGGWLPEQMSPLCVFQVLEKFKKLPLHGSSSCKSVLRSQVHPP